MPGMNLPQTMNEERETRLASGFRTVEIKGFYIIPETGIALILDSFCWVGNSSPPGVINASLESNPYGTS